MLKKLLPILFLVIVTLAFFYKVVFFDYVLVDMSSLANKLPWVSYLPESLTAQKIPHTHSDSAALYFPIFKFYSEQFKTGNFPTWMPSLAGGYPVLANSTNLMLNPFSLLMLLLSPELGYTWSIILKIMLAGIGMFLYLRLLKLQRSSALWGALAYMLNSLVMLKLEIPWMTQALWSFPFIIFFLEKTLRQKRFVWAALTALFLACQFVGANPQTGIYVTCFVALYALSKWVLGLRTRGFSLSKKTLILLLSIFLLLPLLAAIQLLPMLELVLHGHRAPNESPMWITPVHLLTSTFPQILGHDYYSSEVISKIERNILRLISLDYATTTLPYLGLAPLLLAITIAIKKFSKNKYILFFTVVSLGLILIQLTTPLWAEITQKIPLLNKMWNTYRINIVLIFSLSALTAFGLDALLKKPQNLKKIIKRVSVAFTILIISGLILTMIFQLPFFQNALQKKGLQISQKYYHEHTDKYYQYELAYWLYILKIHLHPLQPTFLLPLGLLFAIIATQFLFYRKRIRMRGLILNLFVITLVDLFLIGWFYNPMLTQKENVFPKILPIEFLKKDPSLFRVSSTDGWWVIFPDTLAAYDLADIGVEHNLYPLRYNEYLSFVENNQRASLDNPFHSNLWLTRYDSPLLDFFNVKYIITPPDQKIKEEKFSLVYDAEIKIYKNKEVLPRAFLVPRVEVQSNREKILNRLNEPQFDPLKSAIFEKTPPQSGSETLQGSQLAILEYEPEMIRIKANLTHNGFLILADNYYPGWQVYVDQKPQQIYAANYISRGVALPAGEHEVVFKYKPASIRIGFWISLLTFLGILLTFFGKFLIKKRGAKPPKTKNLKEQTPQTL